MLKIIEIAANIATILAFLYSIFTMLKKARHTSTLIQQQNNIQTVNNHTYHSTKKTKGSTKKYNDQSTINLLLLIVIALFIFTIAFYFSKLVSTILLCVSLAYLLKNIIYFNKKINTHHADYFILIKATLFSLIIFSSYKVPNEITPLLNSLPTLSTSSLSELLNWLGASSKTIWSDVFIMKNIDSSFFYLFLSAKLFTSVYLLTYFIKNWKKKYIDFQVLKFQNTPYLSWMKLTLQTLFLSLGFHLDLIFNSIIKPILKFISAFLNN